MNISTVILIAMGLVVFGMVFIALLPFTGLSVNQSIFLFTNFITISLYTLYTYYKSDVYDETSVLIHNPLQYANPLEEDLGNGVLIENNQKNTLGSNLESSELSSKNEEDDEDNIIKESTVKDTNNTEGTDETASGNVDVPTRELPDSQNENIMSSTNGESSGGPPSDSSDNKLNN